MRSSYPNQGLFKQTKSLCLRLIRNSQAAVKAARPAAGRYFIGPQDPCRAAIDRSDAILIGRADRTHGKATDCIGALNGINPVPRTSVAPRAPVHNEWQNITQAHIRRSMVSVPRQLRAIVTAQRGHIF